MSTIIEKHQTFKRNSSLAIRPYTDNLSSNMGLEKYNMVVFENVFHEEQLMCLEFNGIKRYVTGLNEFAPEIKNLPEDEKEAAIKQIRIIVAQLEKELAANVIDPADDQFWNKVKLLKPDNDEFWGKIEMRFGNDPVFLDPDKDPYDLIKLKAIEAGGFSLVAKSLDAARNMQEKPKFYLDKFEETASIKTEVKKLRNRALAELQKMFEKNTKKMFLVAKIVDPSATSFKRSTPPDVVYDSLDAYINGESVDKDKRKTAQYFLDITKLDIEIITLRAMIKDASLYKIIGTKSDGFIYHLKSNTMLGKASAELVEYFKNPLNNDLLLDITKDVEYYWSL